MLNSPSRVWLGTKRMLCFDVTLCGRNVFVPGPVHPPQMPSRLKLVLNSCSFRMSFGSSRSPLNRFTFIVSLMRSGSKTSNAGVDLLYPSSSSRRSSSLGTAISSYHPSTSTVLPSSLTSVDSIFTCLQAGLSRMRFIIPCTPNWVGPRPHKAPSVSSSM